MIKRILTAIDGSDASRRGLDVAAEMARKFDAELIMIYVIRDMQVPDGVRKMADVELAESTRLTAMQMIGQQILDDCLKQAGKAGVRTARTEVRPGDPAGAILRYADEANIDLIVMGSRGLGQLEGMLLGSVSRKVTNLAKTACLTVK